MNLDDYQQILFPREPDIVYIIYYSSENEKTPFYVGQSIRNIGRIGDYVRAGFGAPTDFKVGEAVRYLWSKGFEVTVYYRESKERLLDEKNTIYLLKREGVRLLNDLRGYNYKKADINEERKRIHEYIDDIVSNPIEKSKTTDNSSYTKVSIKQHNDLESIRKTLGEKYITDQKQKDVFISRATQFRAWANYIAALILTNSGNRYFNTTDIKRVLKEILGEFYNRPGAMESSLCTSDMEVNSNFNLKIPFLKRIPSERGCYEFIGFPE